MQPARHLLLDLPYTRIGGILHFHGICVSVSSANHEGVERKLDRQQ
jgi:hypothetical protein